MITLGNAVSIESLARVARDHEEVEIDQGALDGLSATANWAVAAASEPHRGPVYGVNTGFGSLAGQRAFTEPGQAADLSRRLIVSNACGFGPDLPSEVVRAALMTRIASLLRGYSGVRPEVVTVLVKMLNRGVVPAVPEFGSLGASGDLIPLAHIGLVATRPPDASDPEADSGEADFGGDRLSGKAAMKRAGIDRVALGAKEGLALLNGTSFSCALCALAVLDAQRLLHTAEIAAAMTTEAVRGFGDAFIAELHEARGHPGQIASAQRMRNLLEGSGLIDGARDRDPTRLPPQDAYSIRCVPQVNGPVRETIAFVAGIVSTELDAATDNPLIFLELPEERQLKAVSGGNFHAEYLAFASDFLAIALSELASISERRVFRLTDGNLNRGLPEMLVPGDDVGMNCGLMLPQYLAAALVSDCKTLAHPDSVDSIPTSANQEDHVSMGMNAGRHLRQVVTNVEAVLAIELIAAAQALELRLRAEGLDRRALAPATRAAFESIRAYEGDHGAIPYLKRDIVLYPSLRAAVDLVRSGTLLESKFAHRDHLL